MSASGSDEPPVPNLEVRPSVSLFVQSLTPAQRAFLIRIVAPSPHWIRQLWEHLGQWWNTQDTRERVAHITESFNRFHEGREIDDVIPAENISEGKT